MASERETRNFDTPPVVEVVCGVQFDPLEKLRMAHVGAYWEAIRDEYPSCQDHAPLSEVIETYGGTSRHNVQLSSIPPLPRCWFLHRDETSIIQVQRDRFHHNWRKVRAADSYPRYESVIEAFTNGLEGFAEFVSANELGKLAHKQYELTYVNHIPAGDGWASTDDVGSVFPDFAWRSTDERFLPKPEAVNWKTNFRLPERSGRLHVTIRTGERAEGEPYLFLELTVRGFPPNGSGDMRKWFDEANRWIVLGFEDLTHETIRKKIWGQR